jgi:hypothetical protein
MRLPPYDIFPIISGDKISLRQILTADIEDLIEISFYDAIQAPAIRRVHNVVGECCANVSDFVPTTIIKQHKSTNLKKLLFRFDLWVVLVSLCDNYNKISGNQTTEIE